MCAQLCPALCDLMDCSPTGFSVHGILQARLEWAAISFSRGPSQPRDQTCISHIGRQILYHGPGWAIYLSDVISGYVLGIVYKIISPPYLSHHLVVAGV